MTCCRLITIALLLWIGTAGTAKAGPFEDPQLQADRLSADGDYLAALSELKEAYAIQPTPRLLYQMGQAYLRLRQGRAALDAFRRYLAAESYLTPEARDNAERSSAEARAMIILEVAPPSQLPVESMGRSETAAVLPIIPIRQVGHAVRVAKWITLALGLATMAAGATVWALDGYQSCSKANIGHCPEELEGRIPGIILVTAGTGTLIAAGILFRLDYAKNRRGDRSALLKMRGGSD